MPNDTLTTILLTMPLLIPDTDASDEAFAYADERHEIVEALAVPDSVLPADFAEFCRDVVDAVLEAAGFVLPDGTEPAPEGTMSEQDLRLVLAHLPATDLVLLARGGDLPADHPYFRAVRGEAA